MDATDPTIDGHPAIVLERASGPPTLLTVCANCGALRTILFLDRDRWLCTVCRVEGASAPNLFPIA